MNQIIKNQALPALVLAAVTLATGCASGPDNVAEDFGNSVRMMRQAQTYNPETRENVDTTPVETTEGIRMENSLEAYRSSASNPAQTNRPLTISVSE